MRNSHAICDHTVLPATRKRWESHLYPSWSRYFSAITLLVGSSTCKIVSEMTCNVSSGTLNTIIPYHTILQTLLTASPSTFISTAFVNYYHCSAFTIKIGMGQDIHHLLWNSIYSLLDWYTVQFESRWLTTYCNRQLPPAASDRVVDSIHAEKFRWWLETTTHTHTHIKKHTLCPLKMKTPNSWQS